MKNTQGGDEMRSRVVAGGVLVRSVAVFVIQGCAQSPRRTSCAEQLDNNAAACKDTYQRRADTEPRGPGR